MPLIKAQDADRLSDDLVVLDLADLSRTAQALRLKAEQEAERIVAAARDRARQEHEKGYAQGLAAGHEEALRQSTEKLNQIAAAWAAALERWNSERQGMVLEARQSLIELAMMLAERIVHRVPRIDPSVVAGQVAQAIQHVTAPHDATVRVNPSDRPLVEHYLRRVARDLDGSEHITLVDDPSIEPGGCIVTARDGRGRIDATLGKQLQRMAELLLPDSPAAGLEAA